MPLHLQGEGIRPGPEDLDQNHILSGDFNPRLAPSGCALRGYPYIFKAVFGTASQLAEKRRSFSEAWPCRCFLNLKSVVLLLICSSAGPICGLQRHVSSGLTAPESAFASVAGCALWQSG